MSDVPEPDLFPCGCLINYAVVNGVNTMTISPCRQDCPTLTEVLSMGRAKGLSPRYEAR